MTKAENKEARRQRSCAGTDVWTNMIIQHPLTLSSLSPGIKEICKILKCQTEPLMPPKRKIRSKAIIHVECGFGDASGETRFGSTVNLDGDLWQTARSMGA
jgi:hypothetical protein